MIQSKNNPTVNQIVNIVSKQIKDRLRSSDVSGSVGIVVKNIVRRNIELEGRPKWQFWTPSYAKQRWRERNKYQLHIGRRTGEMYDRMTYDNGIGKVSVYSKVPYAQYFDDLRPLYVIPKEEYNRIADTIMRVM